MRDSSRCPLISKEQFSILSQDTTDLPFLNLLGQPAKSENNGLKIYHVF